MQKVNTKVFEWRTAIDLPISEFLVTDLRAEFLTRSGGHWKLTQNRNCTLLFVVWNVLTCSDEGREEKMRHCLVKEGTFRIRESQKAAPRRRNELEDLTVDYYNDAGSNHRSVEESYFPWTETHFAAMGEQ